jgi:rod shape-determining protein MreD
VKILSWFILVYLVLGLQSGLSPYILINDAAPNLVLPIVIFLALFVPRDPALLGAYIIGLTQDVISEEPLGMHALVYGVVALFVRATQPMLYREHWMTQLLLALGGGALHATLITLACLNPAAHMTRPPFDLLLTTVLYTTALTPLMLLVLHRIRGAFAFTTTSRKGVAD